MATSRTSIPASPTSVGATDDAALGGIFSRSNLANPISGADVNGVAINDSTISITINGNEQSFTLNQSTPGMLNYVIETNTGTGSDPNAFSGASITGSTLTLIRESGTTVDLTLPSGGGTTGIASVVYANGVLTVTGNDGTTASNATAIPLLESITVNGNTTNITGTTVDLGTLTSNAMITVETNNANPDVTDVINVNTTAINVGGSQVQLQWNANLNTLSLSTPGATPPAPAAAPTFTFTAIESALATPTPPTGLITPGQDTTITSVTSTITGGDSSSTNPGVSIAGTPDAIPMGGTTSPVNITYPPSDTNTPATDYTNPGTYTITTVTMGRDTNTPTATPTELNRDVETFTRFIPFFQSRTDMTTSAMITAADASTAAWSGRFTAITGNGRIYIAVLASELSGTIQANNVTVFGGILNNRLTPSSPITVAFPGGDTESYNVYQIAGVATGNIITAVTV